MASDARRGIKFGEAPEPGLQTGSTGTYRGTRNGNRGPGASDEESA